MIFFLLLAKRIHFPWRQFRMAEIWHLGVFLKEAGISQRRTMKNTQQVATTGKKLRTRFFHIFKCLSDLVSTSIFSLMFYYLFSLSSSLFGSHGAAWQSLMISFAITLFCLSSFHPFYRETTSITVSSTPHLNFLISIS